MIDARTLLRNRYGGPFFALVLFFFGQGLSLGDQPLKFSPEQEKFFEAEIRPLLIEHCYSCHGKEDNKGGLRLDSRNAILQGGDSGAAAVAGKSAESLILEAVRYESLEMPPDGKLSDKQIDLLTKWVEMGMPWPGSEEGPTKREAKDRFSEEDQAWWAIQPVKKPEPPTALSANPIDAFILEKMTAAQLAPARETERTNLIRRVYYDLIGLPPTIAQVDAFVQDSSPTAYEKVVDDLLSSPRYGERWARHWLDLVRYAESDGYRIDHYRPNAWRYRDYVIASFNADKPYDRFVQEQLAGDELFPDDPQARIATGFMRHWIYEYNNRDVRGQWANILNDITDTTADVFLGLGLQCAKCHDHKFDPLLQRDYYRLQAFFAPVVSNQTIVSSPAEQQAYAERLAEWETQTQELRASIAEIETKLLEDGTKDAISKFPPDIQTILTKDEQSRTPYEKQLYEIAYRQVTYEHERIDSKVKGELKEKLLALRKELTQFDKLKPAPLKTAMTAVDVGPEAPEITIPKRGKKPVAPGYPTLIDAGDAVILPPASPTTTGRRSTLARWLTDPVNPLTARVMVNRVWQYHFGRGLAANASDFGKLGGKPTHPELLDWLASTFVEDGWSLKKLHRRIVLTATYRQATSHEKFDEFQLVDPTNTFYWRGDTRRLDAEQIRDSIFIASGELRHPEVMTLPPSERMNGEAHRMEGGEGVLPDVPKRSIYTRVMRNARDPLLDVFDLPLFFSSESSRNTTTTPVQALMLFNSSEMLRFAGLMAENIWHEHASLDDRIQRVFEIAYSRRASDPELKACKAFLRDQQKRLGENLQDGMLVAGEQRQTGRIPYRDGQAVFVSHNEDATPLTVRTDGGFVAQPWSIENYFQIRSVRDDATVRTLVSKWSGKSTEPGWSFGVTGKGSRRKPQTLVMVMWGKLRDGKFGEAAVFSDHYVALNKPYFAAATVEPATEAKRGVVNFYLKDLSNDDEPLLIAKVEHDMVSDLSNEVPLTIGGLGGRNVAVFDGLIDDIRLSKGIVPESRLLLTSEIVSDDTLGYWRFESDPGVMRDSSPFATHLSNELNDGRLPSQRLENKLTAEKKEVEKKKLSDAERTPAFNAFADLCHAVLNSNEFLYVD